MKTNTDKQTANPLLINTYKLTKKIIKYGFYIFILYFAFKGFMA
ncbi:hypothetical protein [Chryseobacterium sediminis]|nr:hypothetical protein [Chryseobacterium sediminis]MDR6463094.1 hypothetical protein [Chryseobacterium sediminis]